MRGAAVKPQLKTQAAADSYVQQLNDIYTNPSGAAESQALKEPQVRELMPMPLNAGRSSLTHYAGREIELFAPLHMTPWLREPRSDPRSKKA